MSSIGQKVSNMLLWKSAGHQLAVPEKMKQLGQSRKKCLAVDVSGDESKIPLLCCKGQYCIGA